MGIAKRLYLYAVSSISLLVLSIGVYSLVAVALGEIADMLGTTVIGGESLGREQLSLAIALVVVGGPVFAIHWWLVARGWRGTDEAAADDRRSTIRAFHLGLVATVALTFGMYAALQLMERGLRAILGVADGNGRLADEVSLILVAAPVWWFHTARRNADLRHDRLHGASSWLIRLHRYGWAFIGLMSLLIGASQLIGTISYILIGSPDVGGGQDWWRGPIAGSLALIVIGFGIWWLHVDDARRAIGAAVSIGEDDRSSALRTTYFGAVLLVALASVALTVATSIAELGRHLLGVATETDASTFLESVVGPLFVVIPFVLAGWLDWRVWREEAAERGQAPLAGAERLSRHLMALVGIAFLTVGLARLGGLLLEQILGAVGVDDLFRHELVFFVAQMLVGAALWLPAWSAILRRRTVAPAIEGLASTSRVYMFLIVGGALIAGVPSAVFVLFRLIDALLGGSTALESELGFPVAVVAVAATVAAYHGRLLVGDLRVASTLEGTVFVPVALAQTVEPPAVNVLPTTLALVLRGHAGEDLEAVAVRLREHLPDGVVLEAIEAAG